MQITEQRLRQIVREVIEEGKKKHNPELRAWKGRSHKGDHKQTIVAKRDKDVQDTNKKQAEKKPSKQLDEVDELGSYEAERALQDASAARRQLNSAASLVKSSKNLSRLADKAVTDITVFIDAVGRELGVGSGDEF